MATTTQTQQLEAHELSSPVQWTDHQQSPDPEPPRPELNSDGRMDRKTTLKVMSASFSFFVAGVNDGSVGAIIPYVIREYNVSTAIVSSV